MGIMGNEGGKNITVNITGGTIIKSVLVLLLFYVLYQLRDPVLVVLTSVVIAAAIDPVAKRFAKYKVPRIPAVLLVYVAFLAILAALFSLFLPPLLNETAGFLSSLPQYIETVSAWDPLQNSAFFRDGVLTDELSVFSIKEVIADLKEVASGLKGGFLSVLAGIFGGVFSFVLIIVLSFYLAVQENGVREFLRLITPIRHRSYIDDLWRRSQYKIGLWTQGQLLLIILIGVLTYLGLTILGVPYALLLAIVAGVLELIPIFGPVIAAIPAVLLALAGGISFADPGVTSAAAVILFYVLIQQFENHLIYPLVVRKVVGVPPILVIIALIIGWELAGFLGIILAVPFAAALMEFAHDLQQGKVV